MARVLHRRPSPPYLLIVVVFLFVAATALAVLFYTRQDEARKEAAKERQEREKLAAPTDIGKGYVKARLVEGAQRLEPLPGAETIVDERGEPDPSKEAQWAKERTVVTRLDEHLKALSQLVNPQLVGSQGDVISQFIAAARELNDAQKRVKEWKSIEVLDSDRLASGGATTMPATRPAQWSGVLSELETAYEGKFKRQIDVCMLLKKDVEELIKDGQSKSDSIADLDGKVKALSTKSSELADKLTEAQAQVAAATAKLDSVTSISEDRKTKLDDTTKRTTEQAATINKLTKEVDNLKGTIQRIRMEQRLKDIRTRRTILTTRPDGKITKVMSKQNICYIDIGIKDGVDVGLTFAVYPKTGVPMSLESKGRITVMRAEDTSSECRITAENEKQPIEPDDIIANIAFDTQRKYKFLIVGEFDLYDTGRPTPVDKQEVILLVKRFGGEIVDKLTVEVDYVVMGVEPKKPEEGLELTAEDQQRVKAQKEAYDYYNSIKQEAPRTGAPILNTHRFLDLVGYTPRKTLIR
jgi:FtsZ-binding cell division protein ZapB